MVDRAGDDLVFVEEDSAVEPACAKPWRVLVVDDDEDVHAATRFALARTLVLHRPLELLHAHSSQQALSLLRDEPDIAVILLDVVMETPDAGLQTIDAIRNGLKLANTRIILRTGQPGHAPEEDTITRYDINDYKTKSELTQNKLFTALTAAVRSYDQLQRLDANRRGLEKIVSASNQFIAEKGLRTFADGVITQIASLIGVEPEGLVCAATDGSPANNPGSYRVIAAAGHFSHLIQCRLADIDQPHIVQQLSLALSTQETQIHPRGVTLYFRKTDTEGFAAYIDSTRPVQEIDGELLEIFCTNIALCAKNIDLVEELQREAFIDRQMGLPNRTALVMEINRRLLDPGTQTALALVDLDQFSSANELFGSEYGDALLRTTARRLRDGLPSTAYIARLAGDAFAVLDTNGDALAAAVQRCFQEPVVIEGVQQPVSACCGVVRVEKGLRSGIELLKDGYLALKKAKSMGLGQTVFFSTDLGQQSKARSQLLRDLRLAFDQTQLFLAYQPQIDLATGKVVGAEALLRWRREDGQLVPPDRFIPVAEQSGLIVGMGNWLLQLALLALQRFRAVGGDHLRMAVNVSPVQFRQPQFVELVEEALRETQSHASDLEIEVTESVAVIGLDKVAGLLDRLKGMGITVAIDDFGTGYSSLSYLEKLPANRLKIDRTFVKALERDDNGTRIARTIIALGRELNLKIVAEGVENAQLAQIVKDLGCSEAQGYHYGKPMSENEFLTWLAEYPKGLA